MPSSALFYIQSFMCVLFGVSQEEKLEPAGRDDTGYRLRSSPDPADAGLACDLKSHF